MDNYNLPRIENDNSYELPRPIGFVRKKRAFLEEKRVGKIILDYLVCIHIPAYSENTQKNHNVKDRVEDNIKRLNV